MKEFASALALCLLASGCAATGPGYPVAKAAPDDTTKPGFIGTWEKTSSPACANFPQAIVISLANRMHAKVQFIPGPGENSKEAWATRGNQDAQVTNYWGADDTLDFAEDHFWLANAGSLVYSLPGADGMESCAFTRSGLGNVQAAR
jgi:hypothetical protein